jgi:hypothetical protein
MLISDIFAQVYLASDSESSNDEEASEKLRQALLADDEATDATPATDDALFVDETQRSKLEERDRQGAVMEVGVWQTGTLPSNRLRRFLLCAVRLHSRCRKGDC